jgi:outer membrane receptor protein involved in Fe transport
VFGRLSGLWSAQENASAPSAWPDENTWTLDAFIGYRFPRRHAQLTLGVLNLLNQDYRLHPLNAHRERPRERTLVGRADFAF